MAVFAVHLHHSIQQLPLVVETLACPKSRSDTEVTDTMCVTCHEVEQKASAAYAAASPSVCPPLLLFLSLLSLSFILTPREVSLIYLGPRGLNAYSVPTFNGNPQRPTKTMFRSTRNIFLFAQRGWRTTLINRPLTNQAAAFAVLNGLRQGTPLCDMVEKKQTSTQPRSKPKKCKPNDKPRTSIKFVTHDSAGALQKALQYFDVYKV
eukprot:g47361.t1